MYGAKLSWAAIVCFGSICQVTKAFECVRKTKKWPNAFCDIGWCDELKASHGIPIQIFLVVK